MMTAPAGSEDDSWSRKDWCNEAAEYLKRVADLLREREADSPEWQIRLYASLNRCARAYVLCGNYAIAEAAYATLAGELQNKNVPWLIDLLTIKRIHVSLDANGVGQALEFLRKLEPAIGRLNSIRFTDEGLAAWEDRLSWPRNWRPSILSEFYLESGRILAAFGQYFEATTALRRGLALSQHLSQKHSEHVQLALNIELITATLELGNLQAAEQILTSMPAINKERFPAYAIRLLELRAKLLQLKGDLGGTEDCLRRAFALCVDSGVMPAIGTSLLNLVQFLALLNRTTEALSCIGEVERIAEACDQPLLARRAVWIAGLVTARSATLFDNQALGLPVLTMQGYQEQGSEEVNQEIPAPPYLAQRPSSYLAYFEDLEAELLAYVHDQDLERAIRAAKRLEEQFGKSESHLIGARLAFVFGIVEYSKRHYFAAASWFESALDAFRQHSLFPNQYQAQYYLSQCCDLLSEAMRQIIGDRGLRYRLELRLDSLAPAPHGNETLPTIAQLRHRSAELRKDNDKLLMNMAGTLHAEARATFLLNKWSHREAALESEVRQLHREWLSATDMEPTEDMLRRLGEIIDIPASDRMRSPFSNRFRQHPHDNCSFLFLVLPNLVAVIRIMSGKIDFDVRNIPRRRIRDLVSRFHQWIELDHDKAIKAVTQLSVEIGLADQLRDLPSQIHSLTFLPDDTLHGFPFAALTCLDAGPLGYIVEKFSLSIGFAYLPEPSPPHDHNIAALVTGVSTGIVHGDATYPPLEGVKSDCTWLKKFLESRNIPVALALDSSVSRDSLKVKLSQAAWFHFSGHGVFDANSPAHTGLLLPGAENQPEVFSLSDFLDTAIDLEQVSLFSCWAADNYTVQGRFGIGMPSILWRSGARNILACLWRVEDHYSHIILQGFYSRLAAGYTRSRSLQLAQLDLMKNDLTRQPWSWAGFQVYGEDSPVMRL
jgi:CHAT domain-containing protein